MARSTLLRASVSTLIVAAAALSTAGCIGGAASPSPTASSPAPTRSATATPTATPTPTPTPTAAPEPTPTPTPTTPESSVVSLEILNSSYDPSTSTVSVAGMVTDLVSSTGTCTITVSQGEQSVTTEAAGMADAAVTYCSNLAVVLPTGAAGTWDIELAFTDPTHSGSTSGTVDAA